MSRTLCSPRPRRIHEQLVGDEYEFTRPWLTVNVAARTVVSRKEIKVKSEKTLKRSVSVVEEEKDNGSKAKKKKKKKDEIDAIFGF